MRISAAQYKRDPMAAWNRLQPRADAIREPLIRSFAVHNLMLKDEPVDEQSIAKGLPWATDIAFSWTLAVRWPVNPAYESHAGFEAFESSVADAERLLREHGDMAASMLVKERDQAARAKQDSKPSRRFYSNTRNV